MSEREREREGERAGRAGERASEQPRSEHARDHAVFEAQFAAALNAALPQPAQHITWDWSAAGRARFVVVVGQDVADDPEWGASGELQNLPADVEGIGVLAEAIAGGIMAYRPRSGTTIRLVRELRS